MIKTQRNVKQIYPYMYMTCTYQIIFFVQKVFALFLKALDVVNNIRHHYGLEIDPIKATDNIDALKTFLQDIVNPDVNVADAINMLNAVSRCYN